MAKISEYPENQDPNPEGFLIMAVDQNDGTFKTFKVQPDQIGAQGAIGPQGATGPAGANGAAGATGPAGPAGGGLGYTAEDVANKSTNVALGTSDTLYPSQNAVKTYVDGIVVGLLDDRGSFDASVNLFPSAGGSGVAGAILVGDLWFISVAGTLGGATVNIGDSVRALVDSPGQIATNWSILESNIGFVPENVANKSTDGTMAANSDILYPSQKAVRTFVTVNAEQWKDTRESLWVGARAAASQIGDLIAVSTLVDYTPTVDILSGAGQDTAAAAGSRDTWSTAALNLVFGHRLRHVTIANLPQLTAERIWVVLGTSVSGGASYTVDAPAQSYVGFRYSTVAGDVNWQAISDNGSGVPTVVDTGVLPSIAASQIFRIEWDRSPASVRLYINNTLVATLATTLPASGTVMGYLAYVEAREAVIKSLRVSMIKTQTSSV